MNIWCPYSNNVVSESEASNEHIIPLSLGGSNQFTIDVSSEANSGIASRLDSEFGKLEIICSARRHFALKGRSGRNPEVRWPIEIQGMKGSLDLTSDSPTFISKRSHNPYGINIDRKLVEKAVAKTRLTFDANMMFSFACKVALGTGQYFFPEVFRNYGHHEHLRAFMNSDCSIDELKHLQTFGSSRFWALPWPHSLQAPSKFEPWLELIHRRKDKHVIFTLHTTSEILLGMSLFSGLFPYYFQLSGESQKFPIGGDFELGAVVELDMSTKSFKRSNLRDYLFGRYKELKDLTK